MTFPEILKRLLKENHFSQSEFADRIGVSQQTISRWTTGRFQPDLGQLIACAAVFHVSVDYLLGLTPDPDIKKQPATYDGELDSQIIALVQNLSPDDLLRLEGFVAGLKAARVPPSSPE